MAFNGSGVYNRTHNWVSDRTNSVNITASRQDTEDDGFAAGLTNCVTKDGQTVITANLKMSGKKHIDVAPASAANQYLDVAAAQNGKINYAVTVAGSAASILAMAADKLNIAKSAFFMIHNSWGMVIGNQHDMREMASVFTKFDSAMAGVYADRTGIDKAEISTMMEGEEK